MTRAMPAMMLALASSIAAGEKETAAVETVTVESSVLIESTARIELDRSDIARVSAVTLGDLLAHVPNTKVQTNSRGEQVFALRGSDQRQVVLTLDGAPLVSAWDGQLDLSLLPATAIRKIAITRGPASVLQGPNALFGAVNVLSRRADVSGFSLTANAGSHWQGLEGFLGRSQGRHAVSAAFGWTESEGFEAGGESEVLEGSDFKNRSALMGWNFSYDTDASLGLTLLTVGNSKGVVPERTSSDPRYWRYPLLKKHLLIGYGRHPVAGGILDYSLFLDRAQSRIDQYADETFSSLSNVEDGRDRAGGARLQWSRPLTATQDLSFGFHWIHSAHLFRERASATAFTEFSQVLSQGAVEWRNASGPWKLLLGTAYEHSRNPDTGILPNPGARGDWAATGAINYTFPSGVGLDFTLARKTRFPSLRESYNGALGRFVLNPDLGPETAESAALGMVGDHHGWEWEARAFASLISDGIVRVALPNRQFTRLNQTRSRILGVELGVKRRFTHWLHGSLAGTVLRARAQSANDDYEEVLEYRPGVNLGSEWTVELPSQWQLNFGARYLAQEHGLLEASPTPQELPEYLLWNLSAERLFDSSAPGQISLVLRLDNLADKFYQTQWGLPGTGRRWSVGVTWSNR